MSIELILAIIFFGLLPLIERLIRAARESQEGGTARPAPPPWQPADEDDDETYVLEPPPMPAPPMPAPSVPAPRVPAPRLDQPRAAATRVPLASREAPSRAPSRVTAHDRRTDDAFRGARTRRSRRDIAAALHSEAGLRRAVVLMTILGPCRALSPYDR
ncbi:MAG TPA: hypothetical protein VFZ36_04195 [Vicinamibacterales bacterium]